MKRANKYLSLALALIMALSLCVTSFAANDGSITLGNAVVNETYTLYKIFDATYAAGTASYTFTKTADNADLYDALVAGPFTLTKITTITDKEVYNVTLDEGYVATEAATATAIVDFIKANLAKFDAAASVKATETTVKFENLPYGYYFIDSTLGSLITIDNADPDANVYEKNTMPSIEKKVREDETDKFGKTAEAQIGDTVDFMITVNTGTNVSVPDKEDKNGVDADYTIVDTIKNGMSYTVVEENGNDFAIDGWEKGEDFTVEINGKVATIVLKAAKVATLGENADIVITYSATLDANALIEENNQNEVVLTYHSQTDSDTANVVTYNFNLKKVDPDGEVLEGAKFEIYTAATEGEALTFTKEGTTYTVDPAGTVTEIEVGTAVIEGLDNQNYYLEETQAPDGYNKLTSRREFNPKSLAEDTVEVENKSGALLPSTGGVGTTMFYVLGSVMMIGAAVLLVTKKKMANEQ